MAGTRGTVYSCAMKTYTFLILLAAAPLAMAAPASHCKSGETTYFNCTIKGSSKVVSLCGKDLEGPGSYLQYRYGSAGRGTELVYPPAKQDAAMGEAFFFNPGNARDTSMQSAGVWFEHANTYYELKHAVYIGPSGQVASRESEILMWAGVPSGAPRPLVCKQSAGGINLDKASTLIGAMAPKGRLWQMSPLDVHYKQKEQKAAEKAARSEIED